MIIIMTIIILIPMTLTEREGAVTQSVRERERVIILHTYHTVHCTCNNNNNTNDDNDNNEVFEETER